MKPRYHAACLALAGLALLTGNARGAISIGSGEIALAFYSTDPAETATYIYNLGAASLYRENTGYGVPVTTVNPTLPSANIGADLTAAFGADWHNSGTVRWMAVSTLSSGTTENGDTWRTSYYSAARNDFSVSTTFNEGNTLSATGRGNMNTSLGNFLGGVVSSNQTVGSNPAGSFIEQSEIRSVEEYLPPSTLTYFQTGVNPQQTFGAGGIANSGLEGALDIYRVLFSTSGADLTSGYSPAAATAGSGQFIGTLGLDSLGNLSVIPEPSSLLLGLAGGLGLCLRRRR